MILNHSDRGRRPHDHYLANIRTIPPDDSSWYNLVRSVASHAGRVARWSGQVPEGDCFSEPTAAPRRCRGTTLMGGTTDVCRSTLVGGGVG